jgi:hypothetical protein
MVFLRPRDEILRSLNIPKKAHVIAAGTALASPDAPRLDVVATMLGLYVTSWPDVVRWDEIESARWDEPVVDLVLRDGDQFRLEQLRLDRAGGLPETIHDRVTASVVTSESRDLGDGHSATFVARRRTDDGSINWTVLLDRSADPADPRIRDAAQAHLNDLRESLGI